MTNIANLFRTYTLAITYLFCNASYACTYWPRDFWDPVPEYKSNQQKLLEDIDNATIIVRVEVLINLEEEYRHVARVISGWKEEVPSTIFLKHPTSCGPGVWDTKEYILFLKHNELSTYYAYEVWPLEKAAFLVTPILGEPAWSYADD